MSRLSVMEQWDLHGFFALADDLTNEQALAHRRGASREQPSLPQQAGRAYSHLQAIEVALAKLPPRPAPVKGAKRTNHRAKDLNVTVRALVRPTIDYEKLASALLEHAHNQDATQPENAAQACINGVASGEVASDGA